MSQSKLQAPQYYSHPALTRYFDHIQSSSPFRKSADSLSAFPLISFDLENAPPLERSTEKPKKKEKAAAKAATEEPSTDAQAASAPAVAEDKDGKPQGVKKEKKAKKEGAPSADAGKKKAGGGGGKAAPVDEGEPVPSMIELRVGHIVDGKPHIFIIWKSSH